MDAELAILDLLRESIKREARLLDEVYDLHRKGRVDPLIKCLKRKARSN